MSAPCWKFQEEAEAGAAWAWVVVAVEGVDVAWGLRESGHKAEGEGGAILMSEQ